MWYTDIMTTPMIKFNGKMVPAELKDGKWVPIKEAELSYDGEKLSVKKKQEDENSE